MVFVYIYFVYFLKKNEGNKIFVWCLFELPPENEILPLVGPRSWHGDLVEGNFKSPTFQSFWDMFGFPCLVQACPFQFFDLEFHGKFDGKTGDNLLEAGVSLSLQRMGKENVSTNLPGFWPTSPRILETSVVFFEAPVEKQSGTTTCLICRRL